MSNNEFTITDGNRLSKIYKAFHQWEELASLRHTNKSKFIDFVDGIRLSMLNHDSGFVFIFGAYNDIITHTPSFYDDYYAMWAELESSPKFIEILADYVCRTEYMQNILDEIYNEFFERVA